ncbi:MAG TPA: ribonuclease J, partial [Erysipelothrix sp.]|nr:ribonuclease J [Erysipelothrix sp.]
MEKIRFLRLGGNDEDGKNISVIEVNDEMYIVDVGVRYPQSSELLGVEIIIPDFQYIRENKHKLKAIFITHGHDDVMGALPYLLEEVNVPVYTTPLTALMIKDKLKEKKIKNKKIVEIKRNDKFKIGQREIVTFGVTHSIPDTFGLGIKTKHGYIIHASEFVMDFDVESNSFSTDVARLTEIGKEGVLMMSVESVNASKEGFTSPKHRIA